MLSGQSEYKWAKITRQQFTCFHFELTTRVTLDRFPRHDAMMSVTNSSKGNTSMITVANRLYVKPEFADAFEKVFRERAGLVDKMDGFISNQVLRPVNEGDPYVVFTTWNSRQDFLNWIRSDAFVKGHAQSATLPRDAYA
jgi:heme-degrading monooxygenase HmoA